MMYWMCQAIFLIAVLCQIVTNIQAIPLDPGTLIRLDTRDLYDGVGNDAEKDWCFNVLNPSRALNCEAKQLADEASNSADRIFLPNQQHNGPGDAYRHCYWSGLLTFKFGESGAKGFGDRHEDFPNNPPGEKAMDLHNNNVGRTIAQQIKKEDKSALSAAFKQAASDGRLKT